MLGAGEKDKLEMLSVGGSLRATSDLRSPRVLEDEELEALPKRPDMVGKGRKGARRRLRGGRKEYEAERGVCCG